MTTYGGLQTISFCKHTVSGLELGERCLTVSTLWQLETTKEGGEHGAYIIKIVSCQIDSFR